MAILESTSLKREFKFKKNGKTIELDDFNPNLPPEDIIKFHAGTYPELTTATVGTPEFKEEKIIFNITGEAGTKG